MEIRDRRGGGFLWINNEIIDDYATKIGGTALLVYMVLCRYANNETGQARPSQETLAEKCGVASRSIRRAIVALEEAKLIEKQQQTVKGQWDSNVYYLLQIDRRPNLASGHTVGQTVGHERPINKTEQDRTISCPPSSDAPKESKETDPRYKVFIEAISSGYKKRGWEFAWGARDGKQMKALLKEHPAWTVEMLLKCLKNYFASEKVVPGDQPYRYLTKLPRYHAGPLNEFGKLLRPVTVEPTSNPFDEERKQLDEYKKRKGVA